MSAMRFRWVPHAPGTKWPGPNVIDAARWDDGSVRIEHVYEPQTAPTREGFPDTSWVRRAPYVQELRGLCQFRFESVNICDYTDGACILRYEGVFRLPDGKGEPFARTRTWVTSFLGYDEIWVDHSIAWIRPMRDYRVMQVGFNTVKARLFQWPITSAASGWHERPWLHGTQPLGEPLAKSYLDALTEGIPQEEFAENKKEQYLFGDLCGTSIRNQWILSAGPETVSPSYFLPPLGPPPEELEASGALGDMSCGSSDAVDDYIVDMARSFHERAAYGRFTSGNPPRKWVAKDNRPSAHRPGIGSYYCWGETLWLEAARQGNSTLYTCAQSMTDHMVQMGQCASDFPATRWHRPGAFWKNGEPFGNPEGMPVTDDWSSHFGRTPDPQGLLYAYLLGGDHRAKWGFDLWRDNANFAGFTGARNRESAKTIGMVADVCEWQPEMRPTWQPYLERLVTTQIGTPGFEQSPNSLWDPLWPQKAWPHLSEELRVKLSAWLIKWNEALDSRGITRNQDTEAMGLTMLGAPWGDKPGRHLPWIAHQVHRAEGVGPGAIGDAFLARQWGHYRKYLERHKVDVDLTRTWKTLIPAASISFNDWGNVLKKGTRFTVSTESNTLEFPIRTYPVSGDPDALTIVIQDEAGNKLHVTDWRYTGSLRENDGSYIRYYALPVPVPGRYHIRVGGHEAQILVWPGVESVLMPAASYLVGAPFRLAFRRSPSDMQGPMAPITVRGQSPDTWVEIEGGKRLGWMQEGQWDPNGGALSIIGGNNPEARITLIEPLEVVL